jgi:hypothetical protein
MIVLQIEALVFVIGWFAFTGISNAQNGILWAIVGGLVFFITHAISLYVVDYLLTTSLSGSVAPNGIDLLRRMIGIGIGIGCCFLVRQAWINKASASRSALSGA